MRAPRFAPLFALATLAACGGSGGADKTTGPGTTTPSPTNATVSATPSLAFTPGDVAITSGGTVSWAFGNVEHGVVFTRTATDPGGYDAGGYYTGGTTVDNTPSDIVATHDATVSRRFAAAGVYAYHCLIHPQMTGTVTVR